MPLPDRDRIEQLRLGEPVQAVHEIGAQECEQDVAAAAARTALLTAVRPRLHSACATIARTTGLTP